MVRLEFFNPNERRVPIIYPKKRLVKMNNNDIINMWVKLLKINDLHISIETAIELNIDTTARYGIGFEKMLIKVLNFVFLFTIK